MDGRYLVLLSGGLDSATVMALLGPDVALAVGFDYGQPHVVELEYAERLATAAAVPFRRVALPFIAKVDDVVFAARNAVMISVAASIAQAEGIRAVAIGSNWSDWERFPDCRPLFVKEMSHVLENAYGVVLVAPLLRMSKAQVAEKAREFGVGATWSCYAPRDGTPCGECLACAVRAEAGA